jgi:hypothetical protein
MMTDKPPYGDGNDIYFQCADIALRSGTDPGPDPDPAGDLTSACSSMGDPSLLLALLYWPMKKRRKRQARAFHASSS